MQQAPIVEFGGRRIRLKPPQSVMVCQEIAHTAAVNRHRAAGAALMACWPADVDRGGSRHARRQRRDKKQDREQRTALHRGPRVKRPAMTYTGQPLIDGARFVDALMKQADTVGFTYGDVAGAGMVALALVLSQVVTEDDLQRAERSFIQGGEE